MRKRKKILVEIDGSKAGIETGYPQHVSQLLPLYELAGLFLCVISVGLFA
jgi:hypothetical protein